MNKAYFIGIDIGTQGARVALLDETGLLISAHDQAFALTENSREEQSPEEWWEITSLLMESVLNEARASVDLSLVKAVAVTSTSGTIIPIDKDSNPLHAALMYSDQRSDKEAARCKAAAEENRIPGYRAFNTSSGLPKMLWFLDHFPEQAEKLSKFIHASDFITGRLCGEYAVTDYTNALKSGFDLHHLTWPEYLSGLGIRKEWLQEVKPSGTPIAPLRKDLAEKWGLPTDVTVTTGMTDGCVSQVASGAVQPGQWNTTIGTTLVIKGVTRNEIRDETGAIYNHRHPEGYWMPGGASNTGADWVTRLFGNRDLAALNAKAAQLIPTGLTAWPLLQKGERFPFFAPQASGFWNTEWTEEELFAACMEGVAYVERYAYERIRELSGEKVDRVFSAGGGSNSDVWLSIRSTVMQVPVQKMKNTSGAAGAAVLAASGTYYSSLSEAAEAMIRPEKVVEPVASMISDYEHSYRNFIIELKKRNIL
ncbi:MAG: FGGY-family carbohydrate kinase [Leadbetterella sp.]|nr:FGGY-family carbohydrate kinase [Leadbetterella sp.]